MISRPVPIDWTSTVFIVKTRKKNYHDKRFPKYFQQMNDYFFVVFFVFCFENLFLAFAQADACSKWQPCDESWKEYIQENYVLYEWFCDCKQRVAHACSKPPRQKKNEEKRIKSVWCHTRMICPRSYGYTITRFWYVLQNIAVRLLSFHFLPLGDKKKLLVILRGATEQSLVHFFAARRIFKRIY